MSDLKSKNKNTTKLFFSGVLVLTITNLLVKVIGMMFKIPMNIIIGNEGMGYYNSAYTFYTYLYMVSTAGLPTAISILISDSRANRQIKQAKRIYRISLLLFIVIGIIATMIMLLGSTAMSKAIGAEPTKYSIIAIAPTLLFICICSALRGYFQGYQQMVPTAISQFLEAACKLGVGIAFALFAKNCGYGVHIQAAYATVGLTVGALAGMMVMVIAKLFFKEQQYDAEYLGDKGENDEVSPIGPLLKKLLLIALPITISASVMSLTNLIDAAIVQRLLQSTGLSQVAATAVYGNYTSLAVPMFNLPPVLIYPISYSIVPLLAAAKKRGDTDKCKMVSESSLRVAMIVGIPCGLGLAVLAKPILTLLSFPQNSVELAHPLLTLLAPSTAFICILSVSNAILQSAGYERKPLISMLAGASVKIATNFILIRYIGMKSTPVSTFLCYLTVTVLNLYFISKYAGVKPKLSGLFGKPLLAGSVCAIVAYFAYGFISGIINPKIAVLASIAFAGLAYAVTLFLVRGISGDDVKLLPKGAKIYTILNKLKLVK